MCVNYKPPTRAELLEFMHSRMNAPDDWPDEWPITDWPADTWQDRAAPIIRSGVSPDGHAEVVVGSYGFIPKSHLPEGKKSYTTMNARAETIGEKRAYAKAWRQGQTCLVPMHAFREPNYESGKSEWWSIGMADDALFCVAGLWRTWAEADGSESFSFTQITVNADEHPLMSRFHKPGDEKRSLVIVPPSEYDDWLSCRDPEVARFMLSLYPAELMKAWPPARKPVAEEATPQLF